MNLESPNPAHAWLLTCLRTRGPLSTDELLEWMRPTWLDAESLLRDLTLLKDDGSVRKLYHSGKWSWDQNFTCQTCQQQWPEVKRGNVQKNHCYTCLNTYHQKYRHGSDRVDLGDRNAYTKTRLSPVDVGPAWAGRLSAEYLGRSIRG